MVSKHPQINACLFDMDGLLIDSERIYTVCTNEVLAPYGKEMTWDIKAKVMGMPGHKSAEVLIRETGVPLTVDQVMEQLDVHLQAAFAKIQPMPGVIKLVSHLKENNVPMAIATGSKKVNFDIKRTYLPHLFDFFDDAHIICGDDPRLNGKGKPDPTIFLEAAKTLGIESEQDRSHTLVFEDGAPGVRAARAAGMEVVWVPDVELLSLIKHDDLNPSHTLPSLEHFNPADWGLPAFADDEGALDVIKDAS